MLLHFLSEGKSKMLEGVGTPHMGVLAFSIMHVGIFQLPFERILWVCFFLGDQLQVRLRSSTLAKQTPETYHETDPRNRPLR